MEQARKNNLLRENFCKTLSIITSFHITKATSLQIQFSSRLIQNYIVRLNNGLIVLNSRVLRGRMKRVPDVVVDRRFPKRPFENWSETSLL
jgi:hypothetical protein